MQNLNHVFYFFLFFFLIETISAQNNAKVGQMYENLAYKEVIKIYENKEELSLEDMERLANGYRLNHDTENAALWYGQVVKQSNSPINYLYFAQALQSSGDYEKAKKYFLKYNELVGNNAHDQRGKNLAEAIDRMNNWENEEDVILKEERALNSENLDFSPTFYKDGIVFVSSRKSSDRGKYKWTDEPFMNLYYAQENEEGELSSISSFSKLINSKFHEGPVAFSKSFDRIFFTRNDHLNGKVNTNKKGVMKLGIFTALKDGDNWTAPRSIDFNTPEYEECHPSLSSDGNYLYFASDREGGQGGMDIYVSEFQAGKWSTPVNLGPTINTPGNDVFPFIHDDGTLYFASDGWGGLGGLDIFYSEKDANEDWTKVSNMGTPYNSRKDDFGIILNVLGTEGYLNSSRSGGKGKDDIYSFKRNVILPKKTKSDRNYTGKNDIVDSNSGSKIVQEKIVREAKTRMRNDKNEFSESEINTYALKEKTYTQEELDAEIKKKMFSETEQKNGNAHTVIVYVGDEENTRANNKEGINLMINISGFNGGNRNTSPLPTVDVLVGNDSPSAHTDSRGKSRYNKWLSRKRAQAAMSYLIDRGIKANRIIAKGYGETKLLNNCDDGVDCDEKYHQENRRTEVRLLSTE